MQLRGKSDLWLDLCSFFLFVSAVFKCERARVCTVMNSIIQSQRVIILFNVFSIEYWIFFLVHISQMKLFTEKSEKRTLIWSHCKYWCAIIQGFFALNKSQRNIAFWKKKNIYMVNCHFTAWSINRKHSSDKINTLYLLSVVRRHCGSFFLDLCPASPDILELSLPW